MAQLDGQHFAPGPMLAQASDDASAATVLRWASRALVTVVWISAIFFGLYILAFYAGAVADGVPQRWNDALPRLYEAHERVATLGIGAHFVTGTILLLLGPVQLISAVRARAPRLHRWCGRVYV